MKVAIVTLTVVLCMTGAFSVAQAGEGKSHKGATVGTTGQAMHGTRDRARRDPNGGNPNGTAGGPTSLSGTGSSQYGGNGTAGTTNGR